MANDQDKVLKKDNETIMESEKEQIPFDIQYFTDLFFSEIFENEVPNEDYDAESIYFQEKTARFLFNSIFSKLASLDTNIKDSLSVLDINENQKYILQQELKDILQKAIGQTVVTTRLDNKLREILVTNDKVIDHLDSLNTKLDSIGSSLSCIKRSLNNLENHSISYKYLRLTVYVAERQKREEIKVGNWFNKKKEISYEDAYFIVIEENGREVKSLERGSWRGDDIDEDTFWSLLNDDYGANGWDLIKLPEKEYSRYNCLLKKQIIR